MSINTWVLLRLRATPCCSSCDGSSPNLWLLTCILGLHSWSSCGDRRSSSHWFERYILLLKQNFTRRIISHWSHFEIFPFAYREFFLLRRCITKLLLLDTIKNFSEGCSHLIIFDYVLVFQHLKPPWLIIDHLQWILKLNFVRRGNFR